MSEIGNTDEILDFAIAREQEAVDFYAGLAQNAERKWMKDVFAGFADEERGHKRKLVGIKEGRLMTSAAPAVKDLRIGDYLVDVEASPDMNYQDALIVAMKKEKAAFRLYMDLSERVEDEALKNTFLLLAHEEAKHKLRFELEYDDYVLTDN